MVELLDQLRIVIEQIVTSLGYPGIGLVMFLENIFPPIPSELVMPFGGFLVADGKLSFLGILIAGTAGSVLGAVVIYYIGAWANEPLIRTFIRRYGRFLLITEHDLDRALDVFDRYGEAIIFVGRLIPLIRSLISLPAGMNRMPMRRFLFFTTLGAGIWTALLSYAGMLLGENWQDVMGFVKQYETVTLLILAVAVIVFVVVRVREVWMRYTDPV